MARREVTQTLTQAAIDHWTKLRYGVFVEVGVTRFGRLRCDVLAIKQSGHVVAVEIKSGIEDFRADKKWPQYREHCDQFIMVVPATTWDTHQLTLTRALRPYKVGLMILDQQSGYLRSVLKAPVVPMDKETKFNLVFKLAWRAASFSKRNRPRRTRRYL